MRSTLVLIGLTDVAIVVSSPFISLCSAFLFLCNAVGFFLSMFLKMAVHAVYILYTEARSKYSYLDTFTEFRV